MSSLSIVYFLTHEIERIKELIFYDEPNLTKIACMRYYSSITHLSNWVKKFSGLTPIHFREFTNKGRDSLGNV